MQPDPMNTTKLVTSGKVRTVSHRKLGWWPHHADVLSGQIVARGRGWELTIEGHDVLDLQLDDEVTITIARGAET